MIDPMSLFDMDVDPEYKKIMGRVNTSELFKELELRLCGEEDIKDKNKLVALEDVPTSELAKQLYFCMLAIAGELSKIEKEKDD